MLYFHSWSGGKDSTASVILDHIHGLPPSKIIFSEVMFDKKRGISGELPEHIDFVMNKAKPLFESWGYTVEIVHAEKDYLDLFFHVLQRSKVEERIGKHVGWLLGGACAANRDLKIKPIRDYYKRLDLAGAEYRQYVGIAIDEPKRLERLRGSNKRSLPCIEAPWDAAFQKRYCSSCTAENCDACANEQFRNNPEWRLSLPAAEVEQ